ncbi:MAG: hypothetical protein AAF840_06620 [Bacteroidota bacterium]
MFERIKNWEHASLSQILYDLLTCYRIACTMQINEYSCESGAWIVIEISYQGQDYLIDGSRLDVVRRRLINWIDRQHIRDNVIKFLTERE